jgi:hypothetical protein
MTQILSIEAIQFGCLRQGDKTIFIIWNVGFVGHVFIIRQKGDKEKRSSLKGGKRIYKRL